MLNRTEERLGHLQAHTVAQRLATVSGLNHMFPGSGVLQGLRYVFSCLVGVSKMSAQSASTCINHTDLHSFIHSFMHLANAFIQSDLQCIQVIHV